MKDRIIVIGASTDGIAAVAQILRDLPAGFAAAIFVVLHIGARSTGRLPAWLADQCHLPVAHPEQGQRIEPGHVYVAPPDLHMLVGDGAILLSRGPRENFARPAIDPLFRSAALAYGANVIGVVLTGHLYDGTAGLRAIKDRGGVTIVQDPVEAGAPSMPRSALAAVPIDHVCALRELAPRLIELVADAPQADGATSALMALESRIAGGQAGAAEVAQLAQASAPAAQPCPECGAAMYLLGDPRVPRYRCAHGHGYTATSLALGPPPEASDTLPW